MNPIKSILITVAALIFLSGCIQIKTKLYVNKDGSGTIVEQVMMSKTFVNMLAEFAQSFQDSTSDEKFTMFKDEEIISGAQNFGEGVEYVSHDFISNKSWEGYSVSYAFNDVGKIKLSPDPDEKVDVGTTTNISEKEEYYFFTFNKGDISELIIDRPEFDLTKDEKEDPDEDSVESDNQLGDEFMKMLEGMSIKVTVQVDGDIVNTNATYVDNSEITLVQMDFSEMMRDKEKFKEFTKKEPSSIEEMKEFLEIFPGMKLETEKPVSVQFK